LGKYADQAFFLIRWSFLCGRCEKPDPRIYHLALERLKVKPQDCLYVGDGSSHELTGARKVGMHPVQIHVPDEIVYFWMKMIGMKPHLLIK